VAPMKRRSSPAKADRLGRDFAELRSAYHT
jgi:hypothetical protein